MFLAFINVHRSMLMHVCECVFEKNLLPLIFYFYFYVWQVLKCWADKCSLTSWVTGCSVKKEKNISNFCLLVCVCVNKTTNRQNIFLSAYLTFKLEQKFENKREEDCFWKISLKWRQLQKWAASAHVKKVIWMTCQKSFKLEYTKETVFT